MLVFKKDEYCNGFSHPKNVWNDGSGLAKVSEEAKHHELAQSPEPFFGLVQLVQRGDREQLPSTSIQATPANEYPDVHSHPRNDQKTEEY